MLGPRHVSEPTVPLKNLLEGLRRPVNKSIKVQTWISGLAQHLSCDWRFSKRTVFGQSL